LLVKFLESIEHGDLSMEDRKPPVYEAPAIRVLGTLQENTLLRGKSFGSPHDGDFIKGSGYLTSVS
jgi:hypothetical protein